MVKENNVKGIFHLGAMLSLPSEDNPWASYQTNVAGTMHVLEAARLFDVERMVFASSGGTYGLGTGDIITDEASMLAGSMGMLPSASLAGVPQEGVAIPGLYEPIHGSAPRRAGLNMANPIAIILSIAMMLRYSLALKEEAQAVETAVDTVLNEGYRTYDIMDEGETEVGTKEMGDLISGKIGG